MHIHLRRRLERLLRCRAGLAPPGKSGWRMLDFTNYQPVSAFFYISPQNGLLVTGELKPKSRFLGNSAATIMEGEDRIRLLDRPEDGEYVITVSLCTHSYFLHHSNARTRTHGRCPTRMREEFFSAR